MREREAAVFEEVDHAQVRRVSRDRRSPSVRVRGTSGGARGRGLVRSDREQPRRDIRPNVHRERNARRPRAALGSGLCRRHGSCAVRARGLLRAGLERSQARQRRAATGQHTDLVDADVRRERQYVRGPRCRCVRLAPVDRPSHRDRHDDGALDRSRRKRHRPDVPGADRPRQPEPRSRPAPIHAALVGGGDRDRRDRRHRGHHRDARADHSGGEGVERGRTSGLGDARDEGDGDPGHAGKPGAGECERPRDDHADRPDHRSERRSGARVPGAVRPDLHNHQVRRRRELAGHRGHHDRRPGAGRIRGRHRVGRTPGSQQDRVGVAVARVDRGARQSHASDRRERQSSSTCGRARGTASTGASRRPDYRPTATTATSSGMPRRGCTRRCSRSTKTWPPG